MTDRLNPDGVAVVVGDVQLITPGLMGSVDVHYPGEPGMRAAEDSTDDFLACLERAGIAEQLTVEITEPAETDAAGGSRASGGGQDIDLEVPGPGTGLGQMLLYTAEDGSVSWHFPLDVPAMVAEAAGRGAERRTYRIPRQVVPAPDAAGSRGLVGTVGKKLLKILVFPLADLLIGKGADYFVSRWEASHRPHRLRMFDAACYRNRSAPDLGDADWNLLSAGPALLFVHGFTSLAQPCFRRMPLDLMQTLGERYEGRLFALDHPTVSVTPTQNARWLAQALPVDQHLTIDILAHSRGGLVSRVLAQRAADVGLAGRLTVRTLVMAGTPNAGTILAHGDRYKQLFDRLTNLIQLVPDNPVTDTLDVILTVVQQLAVGAVGGLEGVRSMDPAGDYLTTFLNTSPESATVLHAVCSNYEPVRGTSLLQVARDGLTDVVFGSEQNDLVVPTRGVYEAPAPGFPLADPLVFQGADSVDHSSYWSQPRFATTLKTWLRG